MNNERLQIKQRLKDDLVHYANRCLKIRRKDGSIEPFIFNQAQKYIHSKLEEQRGKTGKVRALILKGRQMGCSTLIGGRFYHKVTHSFGCQAFILTHSLEATNNLYKMAQRFYEHTPQPVKPQVSKSNAKELVFGILDSGYRLGTAENKNVGRSATIQLLHGSEVAFWNNAAEHATGIMQAVPNAAGTEIIMESTANGVGNYFHQMWQQAEAGLSDFIAIFVPWYWQDEYYIEPPLSFAPTSDELALISQYGLTHGQLLWRRNKITELSVNGVDGTKSFQQEYPNCAAEAFVLSGEDNYIPADIVTRARKTTNVEGYGPIILGVDPARFGDDRSCIIFRHGRLAYGLGSFIKKDTMEMAGIVYQAILLHKPHKVCVDVGGLGAGVVDRLKELVGNPDIVVPVNFGSKPLDAIKYKNKKAEMWGEMLSWFNGEQDVRVPDSDELQADLCNTKYRVDSNSRLEMESKEHMKHRGVRSSDCADALCLVANTLIQTPKGQIPIQDLKIDDEVITPFGKTKIKKLWESETDLLTTVKFSNGSILCGKGEHKVFTWQTGECRLDALQLTFEMEIYSTWRKLKWLMLKPLLTKAKNSEFRVMVDIISRTIGMRSTAFYIVAFGKTIMAIYQKITSFITKTMTGATTIFPTWKLCPQLNICGFTWLKDLQIQNTESKTKNILQRLSLKPQNGINLKQALSGINNMVNSHGKIESQSNAHALDAIQYLMPGCQMPNIAPMLVSKKAVISAKRPSPKSALGAIKNFWRTNTAKWRVVPILVQTESAPMTKVYNLTLEAHNVYYANGILVFNCLTFAMPQSAIAASIERSQEAMLVNLAADFDKRRASLRETRR